MDVEDNAAGEEGMNYTEQSTILLMGYQLQVPWDDLHRNDQNKIRLCDIMKRIREIGSGNIQKGEFTYRQRQHNDHVCQR